MGKRHNDSNYIVTYLNQRSLRYKASSWLTEGHSHRKQEITRKSSLCPVLSSCSLHAIFPRLISFSHSPAELDLHYHWSKTNRKKTPFLLFQQKFQISELVAISKESRGNDCPKPRTSMWPLLEKDQLHYEVGSARRVIHTGKLEEDYQWIKVVIQRFPLSLTPSILEGNLLRHNMQRESETTCYVRTGSKQHKIVSGSPRNWSNHSPKNQASKKTLRQD